MKFFLSTILCFVFVATVFGQGDYGRRRMRPVKKPMIVAPKPVDTFGPMFGDSDIEFAGMGGLASLRGGGRLPPEIRSIIGRTVTGGAIVGGMNGFPRHGGTRNTDGLINGWGADPNSPVIPAVSMWNDPLNGALFPEDYNGQELVFDPVTGRYVMKGAASVGHQIAKETHVAAKTGGIIAGGRPASHNTLKAEHSIAKEANHIARKTIGGVNPVVHDINKQVAAQSGPFGPTMVGGRNGHNIVKSAVQHDAVKSVGGTVAGKPGTINAGHVGVDHPGVIAHNIGKATLGADAMIGHNIAMSAGEPIGVGFINPAGPVAAQVNHDIAKSTGMVGGSPLAVGLDPFGQVASGEIFGTDPIIEHGIAKTTGRHVGISQFGTINAGHVGVDAPEVIAHNIGKATLGADAMVGHNIAKSSGTPVGVGFINPRGPIAAQVGHDMAKASSGVIVDPFNTMGAVGGVSVGHVGAVRPVGIAGNPVHNVNKVGQSGLATLGHDPLASSLGHGIAKQAVGEAALAVDLGSRGAVRAGDPFALAATQRLAEESIHVAGKTMDIASGRGTGRMVGGFPQGPMVVQPKPIKKPFPAITGYGRRSL